LWVACGSALGGLTRYWCYGLAARYLGETFPWGTLLVNVAGCTFIGFFAALTGPEGRWFAPAAVRQFVMPGVCGGFTTFSTFSLETRNLARDGDWGKAAGNIAGSLLLCLAGVWLGYLAASALNER
jgi:CrcB protein